MAARRRHGVVRNVAQQLAQMAVGWQAMFDGPEILGGPPAGTYAIDTVGQTSLLNGQPADLKIASVLRGWLDDELARHGLPRSWLRSADVHVKYRMVPSAEFLANSRERTTADTMALMTVMVSIETADGPASCQLDSHQPLLPAPKPPG